MKRVVAVPSPSRAGWMGSRGAKYTLARRNGRVFLITVNDVSLNFDGQNLFSHVDLKFAPGNCYGVIGANGAGKSTFLRILSGELEPSHGEVSIGKNERMSVLKQNHFAYDAYSVLDTIIMGNPDACMTS